MSEASRRAAEELKDELDRAVIEWSNGAGEHTSLQTILILRAKKFIDTAIARAVSAALGDAAETFGGQLAHAAIKAEEDIARAVEGERERIKYSGRYIMDDPEGYYMIPAAALRAGAPGEKA
jgi:hypothetical protein